MPPVIIFDDGLYIAQSDLHLWKHHLRLASFDRKAELLKGKAKVVTAAKGNGRHLDRRAAAAIVTAAAVPARSAPSRDGRLPAGRVNGRVVMFAKGCPVDGVKASSAAWPAASPVSRHR